MQEEKLNNNQIIFCQEYVDNGLNGTQAYLKAYKSCKKEETAMTNASRLLRNAKVQEYIEELQEKLKDKAIMSAKERMKWLTDVINGNIKEVATMFHTDKEGNTETIEEEYASKLDTRLKAIDTLNKMSGEYKTILDGKIEVSKKLEDLL